MKKQKIISSAIAIPKSRLMVDMTIHSSRDTIVEAVRKTQEDGCTLYEAYDRAEDRSVEDFGAFCATWTGQKSPLEDDNTVWVGVSINIVSGAPDDVVIHELTHAAYEWMSFCFPHMGEREGCKRSAVASEFMARFVQNLWRWYKSWQATGFSEAFNPETVKVVNLHDWWLS
jgi:hypothetical protein